MSPAVAPISRAVTAIYRIDDSPSFEAATAITRIAIDQARSQAPAAAECVRSWCEQSLLLAEMVISAGHPSRAALASIARPLAIVLRVAQGEQITHLARVIEGGIRVAEAIDRKLIAAGDRARATAAELATLHACITAAIDALPDLPDEALALSSLIDDAVIKQARRGRSAAT